MINHPTKHQILHALARNPNTWHTRAALERAVGIPLRQWIRILRHEGMIHYSRPGNAIGLYRISKAGIELFSTLPDQPDKTAETT